MSGIAWVGGGSRRAEVWTAFVGGLAVIVAACAGLAVGPAPAAYADAAGKGGDFVPLNGPAQLLDTRSGIGAPAGTRGAGSTTTVQVLGRASIPASR